MNLELSWYVIVPNPGSVVSKGSTQHGQSSSTPRSLLSAQ